jgi:PAT family beta-lactamase induction signal transducer AmpG
MQSMLSATYIAGYRIGMLVAGAGGLFLASYFGSTKEPTNVAIKATTMAKNNAKNLR